VHVTVGTQKLVYDLPINGRDLTAFVCWYHKRSEEVPANEIDDQQLLIIS
jgi:hypothetical protein